MPFTNEHSLRLHDPKDYPKFRRITLTKGIDAVLGIKDDKSEIQSLRFDKDKFSPAEAKEWAEKAGHKVIKTEPAKLDEDDAPAATGAPATTTATLGDYKSYPKAGEIVKEFKFLFYHVLREKREVLSVPAGPGWG